MNHLNRPEKKRNRSKTARQIELRKRKNRRLENRTVILRPQASLSFSSEHSKLKFIQEGVLGSSLNAVRPRPVLAR
jgi:hypothetical protein